MKTLNLGIIGLSEGNGHPYSWAAICNGYDATQMANCPFPVIPQYLSEQTWPAARLKNVEVTHIWTQDVHISQQVAAASLIPNVVHTMEELIGQVDGVLLARDDAENHLAMAEPFLRAGLPVFIDKPLALDSKSAKTLFKLQRYPGQLFTCSALRFAKELQLTTAQQQQLGKINHIHATISKDWSKYAIHLIEPVLQLIDFTQPIEQHSVVTSSDRRVVSLRWADQTTTTFTTLGATPTPITLTVYGEHSNLTLTFTDTFNAFKNSLAHFVDIIHTKQQPVDISFVLKTIEIIERGTQ
jgi:predicted dehydrogenase